jgi:hypothetical protein
VQLPANYRARGVSGSGVCVCSASIDDCTSPHVSQHDPAPPESADVVLHVQDANRTVTVHVHERVGVDLSGLPSGHTAVFIGST